MNDSLLHAKAALREQIRARLKSIPAAECAAASVQLCARLRAQPVWRAARTILFFAPLPGEPDVWPLLAEALAAGQTVALPRFDPASRSYGAGRVENLQRDIAAGQFGVREPVAACPVVPLNRLDLTLVPGVAFAASGGRLGRGRGFYDRLLAAVSGLKCGVALDEQLVAAVPVGPQDIRLNCILTPTRWIET